MDDPTLKRCTAAPPKPPHDRFAASPKGPAMRRHTPLFLCLALGTACAAGPAPAGAPTPVAPADGRTVAILHFNDVYEITPGEGGAAGGLARVAGLRTSLRE